MNTKEFYKKLKKDVREARTEKALKLLKSRSFNYIKYISGSSAIKASVKKEAMQEHKKVMKLIKERQKKI